MNPKLLFLTILLAACAPAVQPTPVPPATPTPAPAEVEVQVFFTDVNAYAAAQEPYEVAVARRVPNDVSGAQGVIEEFFKGPTPEEEARGLMAITSGFTGLNRVEVVNGVAHVYLDGNCSSGGATYTIAQPLRANLTQFEGIQYVKIYDQNGETEQPEGEMDSIPFCLEP